ncbi:MAG: aromatic ring-hydroxylating dioxygenase subunit alpha [Geminicoccaceae bacterium]
MSCEPNNRYVRNNWYAIAWSNEVGDGLCERRIMGEPVVLYRTSEGSPAALEDRCPHRFLPLSMGRRKGDGIECGYHGMTFGPTGRCTRIPGQSTIPDTARVRSYPVRDHMGLVWIWPGAPERADPSLLFKLPQYDDPQWEPVHGEALHVRANYLALAENLCDPAHVAFVHQSTLGNKAHEDVPIEVAIDGNRVTTTRWTIDAEPIPLFKKFGLFDGNIDRWQIYIFDAPSTSVIDFGGAATGTGAPQGKRDDCVWMFACHFLTPVDHDRSVDHWLVVKNYKAGDPQENERLKDQLRMAFAEDKAILEAIQSEEERLPGTRPLRIAVDKGAVMMHRIVERLADAESAVIANG